MLFFMMSFPNVRLLCFFEFLYLSSIDLSVTFGDACHVVFPFRLPNLAPKILDKIKNNGTKNAGIKK